MEQPLWPPTVPEPHEIDRLFAQVFALVGEGIAGATDALLTGDRDAAKLLVQRGQLVDKLIGEIPQYRATAARARRHHARRAA